jgi:hypothetical protein
MPSAMPQSAFLVEAGALRALAKLLTGGLDMRVTQVALEGILGMLTAGASDGPGDDHTRLFVLLSVAFVSTMLLVALL